MAGSSLLSDFGEVDHVELLHCIRDLSGLETMHSNAVLQFQLLQIHRKANLEVSPTDAGTTSNLLGADLQARTLSAASQTNQPAASVAGLSSMDLKQLLADWSDMSDTEKTNALASIDGQVSAVSPQAWHQTHKLNDAFTDHMPRNAAVGPVFDRNSRGRRAGESCRGDHKASQV